METTKVCLACITGHHSECNVNCLEDGQNYTCECANPQCIVERERLAIPKAERLQTAGVPVSSEILV